MVNLSVMTLTDCFIIPAVLFIWSDCSRGCDLTNDALCAIDVTGGYRFKQRADLFLGDRLRFFVLLHIFTM